MTNKKAKSRFLKAVENSVPDILDDVLSDCKTEKSKVIVMTKTRKDYSVLKKFAGVAAAAAIVLTAVLGVNFYRVNKLADTKVLLDVNPSVEIVLNKEEKVLKVTPNNKDGEIIVGDMDFKGSNLDVTVNALVGSMLKNGYITELANSILVSVGNNDIEKAEKLQKKLADEISKLLDTDSFKGAVLSQTIEKNEEVEKLAKENNITEGKALLIKQIVEKNPLYVFKDLVDLSINELNLLNNRQSVIAGGEESDLGKTHIVESKGEASDKAYIGKEKAKAIALQATKFDEKDILDCEIEFDIENGVMVYEVEFNAKGVEYSFDINAKTGKIIGKEEEKDDDFIFTGDYSVPENNKDNENDAPSATSSSADTPSNTTPNKEISTDKAKGIAFSHAGVKEQNAKRVQVKKDLDDGELIYDVEFYADGFEYDYEINAKTGNVIDYDKEMID